MVTVTKKLNFIRRVFGAFKVDNAYENVAVVVEAPEAPPDIILAIAPLFPVIFSPG